MKEKIKKYSKYIIILLVLGGSYYAYTYFTQPDGSMGLYKPAYKMDCTSRSKVSEPDKSLIYDKEIDVKKLVKTKKDTNQFEKSNCVKMESVNINNYLVLSDYNIKHDGKRNNSSYQLSYKTVLEILEDKKEKSPLDKKLIESLKFYLKDKNTKLLKGEQEQLVQENQDIVLLDKTIPKGNYQLVLDLNLVKNDVEQDRKIKTYYVFDDLSFRYVRVGE
ncbi:MAG: hypothetical protein RR543_00190 [Erysipelotrichales bacterium]